MSESSESVYRVKIETTADASARRIVALTGTHFPQAEIVRVDAQAGVVLFRWLDSAGKPVDSGNSIARFTPVTPVAPIPPATQTTYPDPGDSVLAAAIQTAGG